jgi:hypothetical protein
MYPTNSKISAIRHMQKCLYAFNGSAFAKKAMDLVFKDKLYRAAA